ASGSNAAVWDLASGRRLDAWMLPQGLSDLMSFDPSGGIHLFRVETRSGERAPTRDAPYELFPRVGRFRELLDAGRMRTTSEITAFNRHVFFRAAPESLAYVVLHGVNIDEAGAHLSIAAFDGKTGRVLSSIPVPDDPAVAVSPLLDPDVHVLYLGWSGV